MRVKCENALLSKLAWKYDKNVRVTINKAVPEILYLTLCTTYLVKNMCDGTHSYLSKFANTTAPGECKIITHNGCLQNISFAQKICVLF